MESETPRNAHRRPKRRVTLDIVAAATSPSAILSVTLGNLIAEYAPRDPGQSLTRVSDFPREMDP